MISKYKTKGAYHWDWYETEEWYKKCVDRCVEFCKGSTLDVGCGDGLVSYKIAENGHSVTGIDNDPRAIELAKINAPNVEFKLRAITPISIKDWEYMVCLNVVEHLKTPQDLVDLFDLSIDRAGIVITDVPQEKPSKYHIKEYTPQELADLFSNWKVVPFQIDENFHGIEVCKHPANQTRVEADTGEIWCEICGEPNDSKEALKFNVGSHNEKLVDELFE